MKNRMKFISILFCVGLILVLFGITYSFFSFTAFSNELITNSGEVYMRLNKSNTNITLNNVFPETYEEASIKNNNYIDFTVIGKNTNNKPVYYEIDLEYGDDVNNKTRINDKYLRFELLDITDSNNIEEIFSNEYFNSIDNERIFIDTINTTNYTRTYRLRMWYDENIIISDTESNANFRASNNDEDLQNQDLPLYTDLFASVKVKVYGDFETKRYNVMGTLPYQITNEKNNITEIYFINEKQDIINQRYDNATINADVTNTSRTQGTQRLQNMSDYGLVRAWLEPIENTSNYRLYIGSEGYTYLSTGYDLFNNFTNTTTIDLTNVRTNFVTTMNAMFYQCSSLTSLDVSNFNTSNVTSMSQMFRDCSQLTNLDLSNFNTSSVTNMNGMFFQSKALTSLNLSNFNTSRVTDMYCMFYYCSSLTSLDVSSFNTSNVTTMRFMFSNCRSLTSLDVSNFNTINVTNMGQLFSNCQKLTSLDLSNFNTSNVTTMREMFNNCSSLTSLDLSSFNTINVTSMQEMFSNCNKLNTIYVSNNWDVSNVTESTNMFYYCRSLVGGSGTIFNSSYTDKTYAHIDGGTSNPGYLTLKSS